LAISCLFCQFLAIFFGEKQFASYYFPEKNNVFMKSFVELFSEQLFESRFLSKIYFQKTIRKSFDKGLLWKQ